jgi:hypothetical protein
MNYSKSSVFSIFLIIATISIVIAICGLLFRTFGDRSIIEGLVTTDDSQSSDKPSAVKCNDPNFRSSDKKDGGNCRRVCVPTNSDGTPRYKDSNGNIDQTRVYGDPFNAMDPNGQPVDQWTSNYFYYNDEFSPITDKSLSCVTPGTDCTQAFACKPDQPSAQGKCTKVTRADEQSCKLIEAKKDDPNSKSYIQCGPCPMIDDELDCSQWEQCTTDPSYNELIVDFSPDWSPPSHKASDKPYTQSECYTNCMNPRTDPFPTKAFEYFLKLNDEGDDGLTTSTCRKIGRNVIECDPISKTPTPSGILPSLSECALCKDPSLKWYARYRVISEGKDGKKYEITPLKGDPRSDGMGNRQRGSRRQGKGASYGPDDGDMSRGSKYSPSQYGGGTRDAREMGKMISVNNQKSKSIEIAKQNSSNEQQTALASSLKMNLDKLNMEYTNAANLVKSNKAKIDSTASACTEANNKLSAFKTSQNSQKVSGTSAGVSIKDKVDAGANAGMLNSLSQAAATACKASSDAKIAYQKSVDDMNDISNRREQAVTQLMTVLESITQNKTTININVGETGGGMNANNDCYGIMGCGSGIDNFYPFPNNRDRRYFNRRTPMPYTDMIHF